MARKKWTPQTDITDSLLRFREKRKWQLSYRRYVLEKMPCEAYAPYFGLDIESLRNWFEAQFSGELCWENFGKAWQFYHIIPTNYFDFANPADLALCWSFINIRVERIMEEEGDDNRINLLAAKAYFQSLHNNTGFSLCNTMLNRIAEMEAEDLGRHLVEPAAFINQHKSYLEGVQALTHEEFNRLNQGNSLQDLLLEREILKKFGGGK